MISKEDAEQALDFYRQLEMCQKMLEQIEENPNSRVKLTVFDGRGQSSWEGEVAKSSARKLIQESIQLMRKEERPLTALRLKTS